MKRILKILRRAMPWLVLIGAGLVLLWVVLAPVLVKRVVLAQLTAAGLAPAQVRVASVGLGHAVLSDLSIGEAQQFRVTTIEAHYSLLGVLGGRVKRLTIAGAQYRVGIRDGKLDLGPLANLQKGDSEGGGAGELPFDELTLKSCALVLHWEERELRLPIEATLRPAGAGIVDVDAHAYPLGSAVSVRGRVGREVNLEFDGLGQKLQLVGSAGTSADPATRYTLSRRGAEGDRGMSAGYLRTSAGRSRVDLSLRSQGTHWGQAFTSERDVVTASLAWGAAEPVAVRARVDAQSPTVMGRSARDARLEVNWQDRRLTFAIGASAPTWGATLEGSLATSELNTPQRQTHGQATLTVAGDWQSLMGSRLGSVTSTPSELTLSGGLVVQWPTAARAWSVQFSDVRAAVAEVDVTLGAGVSVTRLAGTVTANGVVDAKGLRVRGAVDASAANVTAGALSIGSIEAKQVPLVLGDWGGAPAGAAAGAAAKFSVGVVKYGERAWPALSGTVGVRDGAIHASASWPIIAAAGAMVNARATVALAAPMAVEVKADLPSFKLEDGEALGRLIPALSELNMTGTFAGEAHVNVSRRGVESGMTLALRDAQFKSDQWDTSARGVAGTITFDSLAPLTTPGHQQLTVAHAHSGNLELSQGSVNFALERGPRIFVEQMDWRIDEGGRFFVHAFTFERGAGKIDFEVFLEDVSIRQWIGLFSQRRVEGDGRLYGRVPVTVRTTGESRVSVGAGYLYAKPGGGWVRIEGLKEQLDQFGAQAPAESQGIISELKLQDRVVEALEDFDFTMLRFDFIPEGPGVMAKVQLQGRGRRGARQEIGNLTLNIRGFEELINMGIFYRRGSQQALERMLNDVLGPTRPAPAETQP